MSHQLIMESWRKFLAEQSDTDSFDTEIDDATTFATQKIDQAKNLASQKIDQAQSLFSKYMNILGNMQGQATNFLEATGYKKSKGLLQPQAIMNSLILLNAWQTFQNLIKKYTNTIKSVGAGNQDTKERLEVLESLKQLQPWQIDAASFAKLQGLISVKPDPEGPRGQLDLDIQKARNAVIKKSITDYSSAEKYAKSLIPKAEDLKNNLVSDLKSLTSLNENKLIDPEGLPTIIKDTIIGLIPNEEVRNIVKEYIDADNKEEFLEKTIEKIVVKKIVKGLPIAIAAIILIVLITKVIGYILKKIGKKAVGAAIAGAKVVAIVSVAVTLVTVMIGLFVIDKIIDDSNKFADKIFGVERIGKQINQILPNFKSAAKGQKQGAKILIDKYGAKKGDCKHIPDNDFGRRLRPDCFPQK